MTDMFFLLKEKKTIENSKPIMHACALAQPNESIYNNEERTLLELLKNEMRVEFQERP